ncbi:hypothetical protein [Halomicrobium salinisoli]|uniref:hypothetical protein n=1 Tax=Halomicrobium salinisoli TaxID=2878391 RepID=UPI001CF083E6|nr:hypothetical protein [Halomicrobium salinisoli]
MSTDQSPLAEDEPLADSDPDELAVEVERLRAENARLRRSYARARTARYRRTARGFVLLGALATVGAALFPEVRTVLLALGGTGVFAGLLAWFVTPERFVAATVGRGVYDALAANYEALIAELGLREDRCYVPTGRAATGVRLFVPQRTDFAVPGPDDLADLFVVTDDERERGVALAPSGRSLFEAFADASQGPLPDEAGPLVSALRESLVEQFEVADRLDVDLDAEAGRLELAAPDNAYGPLDRFDHPVVSFVAVGLARGLDRPIRVTTPRTDGDPVAAFRWDVEDEPSTAAEDDAERADGAAADGATVNDAADGSAAARR